MSYLSFYYKKPKYNKTIYLDKDGVLNEIILRNRKISSPQKKSEIKIIKNIPFLQRLLRKKFFNLVIVSNQPDISRKIINEGFIKENINIIRKSYSINMAFFCPHLAKDACKCRKPNGLMIKNYRKKYPYAIKQEYFIGDTDKDYYCSRSLKIKFHLNIHKYNKHFLKLKSLKGNIKY